jgi:hypothetical protein
MRYFILFTSLFILATCSKNSFDSCVEELEVIHNSYSEEILNTNCAKNGCTWKEKRKEKNLYRKYNREGAVATCSGYSKQKDI